MEIKVNNLMRINALGHTCLGSSCRCIKHYKNLHRSMQGLLDQWISAQFCVRTIEFLLKLAADEIACASPSMANLLLHTYYHSPQRFCSLCVQPCSLWAECQVDLKDRSRMTINIPTWPPCNLLYV